MRRFMKKGIERSAGSAGRREDCRPSVASPCSAGRSRGGLGVQPGLEDEGGGDPIPDLPAAFSPHAALDQHAITLGRGQPFVLKFHLSTGLFLEAGAEMTHAVSLFPFFPSKVKWKSRNDFFDFIACQHGIDCGTVCRERTAFHGSERLGREAQTVADGDPNPFVSHVQCG